MNERTWVIMLQRLSLYLLYLFGLTVSGEPADKISVRTLCIYFILTIL